MTDKRIYHLSHCIMRLKQRYGLDMTAEDYDRWCELFRRHQVVTSPDSSGRLEGWIEHQERMVCLSYSPVSRLVGTVMPCPPAMRLPAKQFRIDARDAELNLRIEKAAKQMARQLFDDAMKAGQRPKWWKGQP